MSLPLRIATLCFIYRKDRTLLLDFRDTQDHLIHAGKVSPAGGKFEESKDRTIEDCARREILEEMKIIARSLVYRGKVTFLNENRTINNKPMKNNWEVHVYDCFDFDDSNAKVVDYGALLWIDREGILDLPLHEGDRVIIRDWLPKYKQFEGEIVHVGEKLTEARLISSIGL